METQSFVLGMIVTYGIATTVLLIVCLVKISRLIMQQENLQKNISNLELNVQLKEQNIRRILENTNKEITMVERTIMQRIDKEIEKTHRHIDDEIIAIHKHEDQIEKVIIEVDKKHDQHETEIIKEFEKKLSDAISYTDSKVDKVVVSGSFKSMKKSSI